MEYRNHQTKCPLKILMFPWLAYGHVTPYFELAKKLSQRNFNIFFLSTPPILDNIKQTNQVLDDNIELLELRLPSGDGDGDLPVHNHTTKGLPKHLLRSLFQSFQAAASSTFPAVLDYCSPDLVIFDGFQPWIPDVASPRNIPAVNFLIIGSSAFSYFYHTAYTHKATSQPFPFPAIYSRDHERESLNVPWESGFIFKGAEKSSEIVLVNSSEEIDGKYIGYLSKLCKKKMIPIGPLIHIAEGDDDKIMEWLDNKEELSTLYVSFGSEYYLSQEDMEELAYGLELSGVNFIWVIRFPEGGERRGINEALPKGFLKRVKERGLMVEKWAPQAKILSHNNVGAFLSHCGWNSVLESVHFEVPIIALPMQLDQPAHARMAVELGTALEILRNENGKLDREEVAKVIKNVLVEGKVKELRAKVKQVNKKIKMKGEKLIDDAVEVLTNLCIKYKQQPN